ncbi:MAG: hypothetical protein WC483_00025 [Candidatus Paceibacterota bacterium]
MLVEAIFFSFPPPLPRRSGLFLAPSSLVEVIRFSLLKEGVRRRENGRRCCILHPLFDDRLGQWRDRGFFIE